MSGFPPIQIFLLCIAFAILAIPLSHLTGDPVLPAKAQVSPEKAAAEKAMISAIVRLRYAHKPLTVSLTQGGTELLKQINLAASPAEVRTAIKAASKGTELQITATWPEGTPDTALTIELELDGLDSRSETRWSADAQLSEVLTFQW